jgi:hypothetical protein
MLVAGFEPTTWSKASRSAAELHQRAHEEIDTQAILEEISRHLLPGLAGRSKLLEAKAVHPSEIPVWRSQAWCGFL